MSRTHNGKKPPGWEMWSKRPCSGCAPGSKTKQLTHQIERARAKQELMKEPTEPEYDEREYVPEEKDEPLLSCPFCGREVTVFSDLVYPISSGVCFVLCPRCMSRGPQSTDEKKAIALWNTRHDVEIFNTMFGGGG